MICYVCMFDIAKIQSSQVKLRFLNPLNLENIFKHIIYVHTKHTLLYTVLLCYA